MRKEWGGGPHHELEDYEFETGAPDLVYSTTTRPVRAESLARIDSVSKPLQLHVAKLKNMIRPGVLVNQIMQGKESALETMKLLRLADPQAYAQLMRAVEAKQMAEPFYIGYSAFKGGDILSDSLGFNAVLRTPEVDALRVSLSTGSVFEPRIFPFNNVAPGDWTFNLANTLAAIAASKWPANGVIMVFESSYLNLTPGGQFTIQFTTDGRITHTMSVIIREGTIVSRALMLNGVLTGGRPRFITDLVPADPNPNGRFVVDIFGLPTNYVPSLRLLQYGDSEVESFIGLTD